PPPGGRLARPISLAPSAPPIMLRQVIKRNNWIRNMATPEPLRSVWSASWTLGSEAFRNWDCSISMPPETLKTMANAVKSTATRLRKFMGRASGARGTGAGGRADSAFSGIWNSGAMSSRWGFPHLWQKRASGGNCAPQVQNSGMAGDKGHFQCDAGAAEEATVVASSSWTI